MCSMIDIQILFFSLKSVNHTLVLMATVNMNLLYTESFQTVEVDSFDCIPNLKKVSIFHSTITFGEDINPSIPTSAPRVDWQPV